MNKTYYLSGLLLTLLLSISFSSFAQRCNPTETWIDTEYPGTNAQLMTEMNGKLYAANLDFLRQECVLYQYDGGAWVEMSAFPMGGSHYSIATYQGQIYMAGSPPLFGGEGIARWDSISNRWLSVGGGITSGVIRDLEVFQGVLYAAGAFNSIGGIQTDGLAKWDGTAWDSVGNQRLMAPNSSSGWPYLNALQTWNNKLVVGGIFEVLGSRHIAVWDGTTWTGMASSPNSRVEEITVYEGDLIIYGTGIDSIGSNPFRQIARWDGTNWQAMGMVASDYVVLRDMTVYKGDLYVTGHNSGPGANYRIGGGMKFDGVAKWDGTQWNALTGFDGFGLDLVEFNNRLYLCGQFTSSCNMPMDHVVKLCSHLECQPISGNIYQDDNTNCSLDAGEFPMGQQWLNVQPGNYLIPTDSLGNYHSLIDTGTYIIDVTLPNNYLSKCPATGHTVTLNMGTTGATGLNFGYVPVPNKTDVNILGTPTRFRPGFTGRIHFNFANAGTLPQNGAISLTLDPKMTIGTSSQIIASQNDQTVTWNYAGLNPSQTDGIWLEASIGANTPLGDTLCIIANITSTTGIDTNPADNVDTIKVIVTGSYDPNDKQVVPAGEGITGNIPFDTEMLTYTVRFQNTGTDTAFTVVIRDDIDPDLDLGTMAVLGASHAYKFEVEEGRKVKWTFNNILLADSNTNEPASHGFVKYQIKLKPNLSLGTKIENTAYIYFDFNAPIITNTTVSTLVNPMTTIDPIRQMTQLKVWPNPTSDEVNFRLENSMQEGTLNILDLQGRTVAKLENIAEREFKIPVYDLLPGMYMYQLEEKGKVLGVGKIVVR